MNTHYIPRMVTDGGPIEIEIQEINSPTINGPHRFACRIKVGHGIWALHEDTEIIEENGPDAMKKVMEKVTKRILDSQLVT